MKAWRRPLLAGTLLAALAFLIAAIWLVVFMRETIAHLPRLPENPSELSTRGGTKIYAASGERIYTFNQSRQWVDLAHISPHAVAALLATEDSRFYRHAGIDLKSLLGALWANEQHGFCTRGGSTLTQQLAKRLFFSPDKTLRRKLGEILIALELEALYAQHFPGAIDGRPLYKDRLIELYLNTAFYGSNAYGLHDAAAIFFATTPDSLSIEQAALLIGMLNAPTAYNPLQHPERATSRLQHVLTRLQRMGKISAAQRASYDSLRAEELVDVRRTLLNPAPYWVEAIKAEVAQRWDTEALRYGALRIYTTLDMRQQKAAESAVERGLNALDARMGFPLWTGGTRRAQSVCAVGARQSQSPYGTGRRHGRWARYLYQLL
jgi:penicillin-binding protein 1A